MKSTCPRCGTPMGEKQQATSVVMGMDVKGCSECGGFLIDYQGAKDVLSKAITKPEEQLFTNEIVHPKAKKPLTGACPFCGGEFIPSPIKFDLTNNISYIDECAKCQGIWFDMGELSQILDFALQEAIASRSLDEDLDNTFSKESSMQNCPRCNVETEFKSGSIMGIEVSKCKKCNGIWLDSGEVEALLGEVSVDSSKEDEKIPEGVAAEGTCPKCKVSLKRWVNVPEALKDIYIDFCPKCMGLWFDKGEFKQLFRIFSESPFLKV